MNDLSDEQIIQEMAMACKRYADRFGEDELVDMLESMIEAIEAEIVDGEPFK
jgi:hypothetical protein